MKIEADAKLVTIYVNSTDQWHGQPLYAAIVGLCKDRGIAGRDGGALRGRLWRQRPSAHGTALGTVRESARADRDCRHRRADRAAPARPGTDDRRGAADHPRCPHPAIPARPQAVDPFVTRPLHCPRQRNPRAAASGPAAPLPPSAARAPPRPSRRSAPAAGRHRPPRATR